jgi:hypothetical protein
MAFFNDVAGVLFQGYERRRVESGIPEVRLTLILADDFIAEVNRWLVDEEHYDPTRADGAESVAKTISRTRDHAEAVVVFDGTLWHADLGSRTDEVRVSLIAHELVHPLPNRARWASGASQGFSPQPTVAEVLRDVAYGLADEYRAGIISEVAIGPLGTVTVDNESRPLRSWWRVGPAYIERFANIAADAEHAWPEVVRRAVTAEISPIRAWMTLTGAVGDALRSLMDAQAFADAAEVDVEVLDAQNVAGLLGTQRFFAVAVPPFIASVRRASRLGRLADVVATEEEIAEVGARMLETILDLVGIRAVGATDGSARVIVERR